MIAARTVAWGALLASLAATPAAGQGPPVDSVLAGACAGGGGVAEGLLVVVFRADVPDTQRASLAREAGGTLSGAAEDAGPNGHYVTMPPEGRAALDAAADRLIRFDGVQSVGGVACPPPPAPADTAAPAAPAPATPGAPATPATPPPADTTATANTTAPG